MAERRMFSKTIIDSDAFLDMPLSTQALYFHLSMRADDDGFVNNPKKIQRMIGCGDDDGKLLIAKNFIIPFDNNVVVIKHWRIHNYIPKDRYRETVYQEEKSMLQIKDNKAYKLMDTQCIHDVYNMDTQCIHDVYNMDTQVRLGKDSIGKDSIGKDSIDDIITDSEESVHPQKPKKTKPVKHKYGEYKNVLLTDDELEKLKTEYSDYGERIERLSSYVASTGKSYKSHYATIRNWARKDAEAPKAQSKKNSFNNFNQRQYDYEAMERMLMKRQNPAPTIAMDESIKAKAKDLQKRIAGKHT